MVASSARGMSDSIPSCSWWVFLAGLIIFVLFQTGLVLDVALQRTLPPEPKDAYSYIYSAVQLGEGLNYDTPALRDFRSLTSAEAGDSWERQNLKWLEYHSLFFTHYPLHSAILLAISWISGVSLGTAYKVTSVFGSLLIAGAISCFLLSITDKISAGLALGSMALTIFPMQGIHYVVPTNICMAVGLILLSIVLKNNGKSKWSLFGLSLIVIYLHRMGIIYACLGVFATAFLRYKKDSIKQIIFDLLPTLGIIIISILIIFIFPLPFFRLSHLGVPPDISYFKEIWLNSLELFKLVRNWFLAHGVIIVPRPIQKLMNDNFLLFLGLQVLGIALSMVPWIVKKNQRQEYKFFRWITGLTGIMIIAPLLSAIVLIVILRTGFMSPPPEKRISFYMAFLFFFLLLIPSLFHVLHIAEWKHAINRGDLTNRLWIPFAVVLSAVFGRGLYVIFQKIREGSYDFLPSYVRKNELIRIGLQLRYVWIILVLFLIVGYTPRLAQAYVHRQTIKSFMLFRQNVVFDPEQVTLALKNTGPQDIIVYEDEFIRIYYLCHGGLSRRALYSRLIPLPESFRFKPADIKYEITWNPYLSLFRPDYERAIQYPLTISGGSTFTLTLEPHFEPGEIKILSGSNLKGAGSAKLQVIRESALGVIRKEDIELHGNTWQTFPLIPEKGGTLSLVNLDPSKPFYLGGLSLGGQEHNFLWPWQGVTKVSLHDNQLKIQRSAALDDEVKIKDIFYKREVIQDKGSTVLWRLYPEKAK